MKISTEESYTKNSLLTFNGHVTIFNPATNGHRTFEIKTGSQTGWASGQRFVCLKTGSEYGDNTAFGWVKDGTVVVFKKYAKDSVFNVYARMLNNPETFEAKGAEYKFETTCRRCNRPLTVPSSIDRGMGPKCAEMGD